MISILMTSREGDIVLDPYSGTASTGEAALIAGRRYIGYEINNEYALSSLVRLERYHDLNISEILKAG
jgi:adenine-specific DNA-methyltransferase